MNNEKKCKDPFLGLNSVVGFEKWRSHVSRVWLLLLFEAVKV